MSLFRQRRPDCEAFEQEGPGHFVFDVAPRGKTPRLLNLKRSFVGAATVSWMSSAPITDRPPTGSRDDRPSVATLAMSAGSFYQSVIAPSHDRDALPYPMVNRVMRFLLALAMTGC